MSYLIIMIPDLCLLYFNCKFLCVVLFIIPCCDIFVCVLSQFYKIEFDILSFQYYS